LTAPLASGDVTLSLLAANLDGTFDQVIHASIVAVSLDEREVFWESTINVEFTDPKLLYMNLQPYTTEGVTTTAYTSNGWHNIDDVIFANGCQFTISSTQRPESAVE
jgi:hypothetical protein